jgi:hypothetical protein
MILAPTLLLNAGSGAAIVRPTFSRDFAGEKTLNNGTGPSITFTRASDATYFDADGVLQTAGSNVPRFDHDPATGASRGLLIEEARTNSIRNSQAGGAATGTPGTAPTNWLLPGSVDGLTQEIVGTGTENGLAYIDIKYSGTPTASLPRFIAFEQNTQVVAAPSQIWTASVYCKLSAGALTNVSNVRVQNFYYDAANVFVDFTQAAEITLTSSPQQFAHSGTVPAGAARVRPHLTFSYTNGNPIDITLRIAAPQLEQGAFPTSYIPTTTAAATRSADSAVVTPISSFYNASEGTLFAEFSGAQATKSVAQFDDGSNAYRAAIVTGSGRIPAALVQDNSVSQANISIGSAPELTDNVRFVAAIKQDDFQAARGGSLGTADTSGVMPSNALTHFTLGSISGGLTGFGGHICRIAYWPKRLSNALLQTLTT